MRPAESNRWKRAVVSSSGGRVCVRAKCDQPVIARASATSANKELKRSDMCISKCVIGEKQVTCQRESRDEILRRKIVQKFFECKRESPWPNEVYSCGLSPGCPVQT